jgi:hypothetical protein
MRLYTITHWEGQMVNHGAATIVSTRGRNALSACVSAILGLTSPAAFATVFVNNCNDAGAGSLRNAIAGAPSGETVDASGLDGVCSKITLTTGDIIVNQSDLSVKGPGVAKLSVTAKNGSHQYKNRIFTHSGTGLLYLQDVTVSKGYVSDVAFSRGGCIYSNGSVSLKSTNVIGCEAKMSPGGFAAVGGGIFSKGSLTMKQSSLTFSGASGTGYNPVSAGGAYTHGFRAYYSTVAANTATGSTGSSGPPPTGFYGGVNSVGAGAVYLFNSTIALNQASAGIGGLGVKGQANVKIVNSTISSNNAGNGLIGGAYLGAQTIHIYNSTIAANTASTSSAFFPPGLGVKGVGPTPSFVMQSSIIANNQYGSPPATDSDLGSSIVITGSNNLVQISTASLPNDTIVGKCAFLGPLQDNGGLTLTQTPLGHSPAIDKGNNMFGAGFDQRGKLSVNNDKNYPRVLAPPGAASPRADIGAYEVDGADKIYDADFDSC